MSTIINGSSPSITFSDGSAQTSATRPFQNRIINGNMVIDQRNAGASVTVNNGSSNFFITDRWFANGENTDGVYTGQQVSTAPTGFNNSIQFTVTTADASIGSGQSYTFRQRVEGYNIADLGWGTASAQTVTLSFWVRSSLTGTFGGSIFNSAGNRAYVFSYTISVANTFEYKTITIAGDTSGTWLTTNGTGLNLLFSLGSGSSLKGTAGSWGSTLFTAPTGSVDLIGTNGATFYITGVQLEVGSTATSFDYRPYGTELALCQRYYETFNLNTVSSVFAGRTLTSDRTDASIPLKVTKRATPSLVMGTVTTYTIYLPNTTTPINLSGQTYSIVFDTPDSAGIRTSGGGTITAGYPVNIQINGNFAFSAEL